MKLLLPVLLLIGTSAGGAAGYLTRPAPKAPDPASLDGTAPPGNASQGQSDGQAHSSHPVAAKDQVAPTDGATAGKEYVKLNNQFVVPVVQDARVTALVILSLSFEAAPGSSETIYAREPKLRDAFLRVLFDHANNGGFRATFTEADALRPLRQALLETAQGILGDRVSDVLIVDILRQDN